MAGDTLSSGEHLNSVRIRGAALVSAVFWAASAGFVLIAVAAYTAAVQYWLELLERFRRIAGWPAPEGGPDLLLAAGLLSAVLVPLGVGLTLYLRYRAVWNRRLREVWGQDGPGGHTRLVRLAAVAGKSEIESRCEYAGALLRSPAWTSVAQGAAPRSASEYRETAAQLLASIEQDICERAIATGLIVGITRNRAIDSLTLIAAGLELQLHVLARLGKRPGLSTWKELWKRTTASLLFNTYLNREDAWTLKLTIRKAGLGLQAAGEAADAALESASDVNWDEYLDNLLPGDNWAAAATRTGVQAVLGSSGFLLGIGAEGVRQLGRLVEQYGDEVFEGVLAGGVLYYHGMAIASECLALDQQHRESPEMSRTFRQCVNAVCGAAGGLIREQARGYRQALKEKRRQAVQSIKAHTAEAVGERSRDVWESVKSSTANAVEGAAHASSAAAATLSSGTREMAGRAAAGTERIWQSLKSSAGGGDPDPGP